MMDIFVNNNIDINCHERVFQRLYDIFIQESFFQINKPESKLRTYKKLKTKAGFERYLSIITSQKDRISLTKFRLSNHQLMIEKGRHENIPKVMRFCPFCTDQVEDEVHFLMQCKTYDIFRKNAFAKFLTDPNFQRSDASQQMTNILEDMNTISEVAHCINKMFECRIFLTEKHKNFE